MHKNVELIFVRHAESNGNVGLAEADAHPDDPRLTETGLLQAEKLCAAYASEPVCAVYASALIRTCQTVQPLAKKKNMQVRVLRELMEVNTRIANTEPARAAHYAPAAYASLREVCDQPVRFPPEDGAAEVCAARAAYSMETILSGCADGDTVMICTHGGFIGYLLRYCLGLSLPEYFNWQIDNCAVFRIRLSVDKIPKLIRANDVSHLK